MPAVAIVAATLLLVAAPLVGLLSSNLTPPQPVAPSETGTAAAEDWRLGSVSADVLRNRETVVHVRIPPGWQLDQMDNDVDSTNPDYPAVTAWLNAPSSQDGSPGSLAAAAMVYYGPFGNRYDPAACAGTQESYTELDSSPVDVPYQRGIAGTVPPRFVYRVVSGAGGELVPSFGITTRAPGNDTDPCNQYFLVHAERPGFYFMFSSYVMFSGQHPGWLVPAVSPLAPTFSSSEEAEAFMETTAYKDVKRLFISVSITAP
ncbi:hypothetical protein J3A64_004838 [Pseudarthrobacter sp. PvP004]|uniref:hypothetical protein n=1 Tax=Pseudarthrobacter sp. PvP004 TaxID=2817850 RepID=UPI001AE2A7D3|nr:hypothetical protein [Pseudarthrobacter sp. PvP004]MBP2269298.1 hypothetical protein [Pseudarthrobacter sp. PvP004]